MVENAGGTEVLTVTLTRPRLKLGRAPRTFRIEDRPFGLDVELLVYRERPTHSPHCTDIADPPDAASVRWVATRGRVALAVSHPSPRTGQCYTIDARLQDVVFTHGTREAVLAELVLPPVTVGHRPPLDCTP